MPKTGTIANYVKLDMSVNSCWQKWKRKKYILRYNLYIIILTVHNDKFTNMIL